MTGTPFVTSNVHDDLILTNSGKSGRRFLS
jgi:hypothetical protein